MKNIFSVITLKTMRQNRTRMIVTIIGVILSTAMITAVTTFGMSILGFLRDYEIERSGNWHVMAQSVPSGKVTELTGDERVEAAVRMEELGCIKWDKAMDKGNAWGYLCLESLPAERQDILPVTLREGRLPENENEIIIPSYLAVNDPAGEETKVGDVLEVEAGDVYIDGERLSPAVYVENELAGTETLENTRKLMLTVVGVYDYVSFETYWNAIATFMVYCGPVSQPSAYADVLVRMKDAREVYRFTEDMEGIAKKYSFNSSLLQWEGAADNSNYQSVLTGLVAIVTGLIMVGAVSLIYNAFSISLRERTTQFGLLSSIGATKRQLRRSLLYEAFYVSIIGIPVGVLSGIVGIGITLRYVSYGITGMMHGVQRQIALRTSAPVLALTVLLALLTVLLSAWVPSRRVRKISPIEAIRASRDIRVSPQKMPAKGRLAGLFGLSGMLADKNYRRDRKKYRSTIFSLTLSIVLFVSAMSVSDALKRTGSFVLEAPEVELQYVVDSYPEGQTRESIRTLLTEQDGVQKVICYQSGVRYLGFTQKVLEEQVEMKDYSTPTLLEGEQAGAVLAYVLILPDDLFDAALRGQGLDPADYHGQEMLTAAVYDTYRYFNPETERYERYEMFSELPAACEMGWLETIQKTGSGTDDEAGAERESGAEEETGAADESGGGEEVLVLNRQNSLVLQGRLQELPEGIVDSYENSPRVLVPESEAQRWNLTAEESGGFSERFSIMCSDYRTLYEKLEEDGKEMGLPDVSGQTLLNLAAQYEQDRSFLMAMDILSFGFVTLLTLVAAANAFNTISTNLLLRRREFAMLRSMGMSGRGMRRMMCFESLIYSLHSLIPGVVLATGVSYLVYLVLHVGADTVFRIPWTAIGLAAVGVFLIVSGTIALTMRTIRKANICEELKMNE